MQADAFRQLLQRVLVKRLARLVGIGFNFCQGKLCDAVGCAACGAQIRYVAAEQVGQAAAQPLFA